MTLAAGAFLGPYEILSPAGAGGMGEVYRARDTRLDRIVALKVMPVHLAGDPALRERFVREARSISHLNHPNICTLHDVGCDNGVDYLVMEYLEGETLADLIARGPVPLKMALEIALQIGAALERAHTAGIIHRDLKPSNIFLIRNAGSAAMPHAKLLDFGLAKSVSAVVTPETVAPTLAQALTGQGTILGTLQYMAPEQLEGREADARVDIFAFAAVLYEMLTGRRAFSGKSQASLIAAILSVDPPAVSSVQPISPPVLDHVISRALAKDPVDRWTSMHDVVHQLRWIAATPGAGSAAPVRVANPWRERRWWIAAATVLAAALAITVAMSLPREASEPTSFHFEVPPPPGTTFLSTGFATIYMAPVLSHDGSQMIVPAIGDDGVRRLWLRRLNSAAPTLLPRTEGAFLPFWSPDDRSIGFFSEGKLMRLDLPGSPPQPLCDAPTGVGGTWGKNGVIVFAPAADMPLHRVAATGGAAAAVTTLDQASEHVSHRFPYFLPDGRHFLYLARGAKSDLSAILIGDVDSATTQRLMKSTQGAVFAPPNWLIYLSGGTSPGGALGGTLFIQRFDPEARQLAGDPIILQQDVGADEGGQGAYSFSDQGTFVYRTVRVSRHDSLNWYTRTGVLESTIGDPGEYTVPRLSPDGRRLAVTIGGAIWIRDLARGTSFRLTNGPAHCCSVWSPDGTRVAYRRGPQDIAIKAASGTGAETVVLANGATNTPTYWTSDGQAILFQTAGRNRIDTMLLPIADPRSPRPVLQSPFSEEQAQLSPDGRYIAFTSDESGQPQIYVLDYPALSEKWAISTRGGADPQWRADGLELFFLAADHKLMSVPIRPGKIFDPGIPTPLFQARVTGLTDVRTHYQVSRDGQRFLVSTISQADRGSPIQVVVNWPSTLGNPQSAAGSQ